MESWAKYQMHLDFSEKRARKRARSAHGQSLYIYNSGSQSTFSLCSTFFIISSTETQWRIYKRTEDKFL